MWRSGALALCAAAAATQAHGQDQGQAQPPPAPPAPGAPASITVVGQSAPRRKTLDRTVYSVAHDLQAKTGTAADLLNDIPSVNVDVDGNITLRGDPNVTILVDGKPSAQFAGATLGLSLQQFPASEIERIEVLTTPPAQYQASGSGGVINIITKKHRGQGLSGDAQAMLGDKRRFVSALNGAYDRGPLSLAGGVALRQDDKQRLTTTARAAADAATGLVTQSQEAINEHLRRLTPSVHASADYQLSPASSLGAEFSHRELKGVRFFNQTDAAGPPDQPVDSLSDRHSDGHEWETTTSEGAHWTQKLWRPDETLNLALDESASGERETYLYHNSYPLPLAAPTVDDLRLGLDLVKTELRADYDLPGPQDRDLKLGYDLEVDRNAFDDLGHTYASAGPPQLDPTLTNHFRYRQTTQAAYGQYQRPFGAWTVQAGLRLEAADIRTLQLIGGAASDRSQLGAYPSLHLDRELSAASKLSLGLSRRIVWPDPEALNPFVDTQDIYNLRAGNPALRPQETWAYELGYAHTGHGLDYGATAYVRFDRNAVTDVLQPISPTVVLATKANLPHDRSAGLEFNTDGKWGALSYSLSGDGFYSQIDARALGANGLKGTAGLDLKASLDYQPTARDSAQVSLSRTDRRLTPQGYVSAMNLVNLGYRRQLRRDLALVVTVSDALDGQRFQRIISTPQLRQDYVRRQVGRVALAGLVYSFGGYKKDKAFQYDP